MELQQTSQQTIVQLIHAAITEWSQRSGERVRVTAVLPLTPDASLRRYFRATVEGSSHATVIAMYFDSISAAEVGAGPALTSDAAYVELTRFFTNHQILVPQLLFDAREQKLLLIEDLGDTLIGNLINKVGEPKLRQIYTAAIEQLIRIQSIPPIPAQLPFSRAFSRDLFFKEMMETADFFLPAFDSSETLKAAVVSHLQELAQQVDTLPKVLAHRDFHSWNLMWWQEKLRVIDFQDALLAPRTYDLISLLHDRDTDQALGETLVNEIRSLYSQRTNYGPEFPLEYRLTLLQRDLKVVGRFAKLVTVRKLPQYAKWIPGTYNRVISGLRAVSDLAGESRWREFAESLNAVVADNPGGPFAR